MKQDDSYKCKISLWNYVRSLYVFGLYRFILSRNAINLAYRLFLDFSLRSTLCVFKIQERQLLAYLESIKVINWPIHTLQKLFPLAGSTLGLKRKNSIFAFLKLPNILAACDVIFLKIQCIPLKYELPNCRAIEIHNRT